MTTEKTEMPQKHIEQELVTLEKMVNDCNKYYGTVAASIKGRIERASERNHITFQEFSEYNHKLRELIYQFETSCRCSEM